MKRKIELIISGRVQGVYFRKSVKNFCDKFSIFGYAENMPYGDVKVVAEGEEEKLLKLFSYCHFGPVLSKVKKVEVKLSDSLDNFSDFKVLRNGENLFQDQSQAFTNLTNNLLENFIQKKNEVKISEENFPKHIVIIPDGNRRWAKEHGKDTLFGHLAGYERMKEIIKYLNNTNLESLTLWLFSTENWKRGDDEIKNLMNIFKKGIHQIENICMEKKIRFNHFGRLDRFDHEIQNAIIDLKENTRDFQNKNLNLAFDYGGRDELLRAIGKIENPKNISEENFADLLDTSGVEDPDLIIRTSGEKRLSGILPWQSVYSELYFTEKHFPDFDILELETAIIDFQNRKRRYGK